MNVDTGLDSLLHQIAGPVGIAKPLLQVSIVVPHTLPMRGIVAPMLDMGTAIYVDGSAAPVDAAAAPVTAAAPISAGGPPPKPVGRAEGDTCRDEAGADIAGVTPVVGVGGIIGVRPIAKDHLRLIIGHVKGIRHGRFDVDELPVLVLPDCDDLLLGRHELLSVIGLGTHPLHCIHDVLLLGQERLAEFLRPVELVAHHLQNRRCRDQRLDARVPLLLLRRSLQRVSLEILVLIHPTLRLHDFERIGRGHQDVGEQRIRIERDRCHQPIKFRRLEQLLRRGGGGGVRGRLRAGVRRGLRAGVRRRLCTGSSRGLRARIVGLALCRDADVQHSKKSTHPADHSE